MNKKEMLEEKIKAINELLKLEEINKETAIPVKEQQVSKTVEIGRVCNKCGVFKPWIKFGNDQDGYMGKSARCKRCLNKYQKNYQKAKREVLEVELPEKEPTVKVDANEYPMTSVPDQCDERVVDSVIKEKEKWKLFHK